MRPVNLEKLETQAEQIATSVSGSIDSVNELNQKNKQILDELSKLHDSIGGDSQISATNWRANHKTAAAESGIFTAFGFLKQRKFSNCRQHKKCSDNTYQSGTDCRKQQNSLRDYKNSLSQDTLPNVDDSLDAVASVSGNFSAILSGITPTVDQLKAMLQQLQTSLDDSVNALTKTGEALEKVDAQLASTATDVQALQSSEAYQQILSLEGIDAEAISDFMSSPVSITSEVLYDVKNYGSGMTPFYTNLALWVGGLILVSILKQEVDKDEEVSDFSFHQRIFWQMAAVCRTGTDPGIYCVSG